MAGISMKPDRFEQRFCISRGVATMYARTGVQLKSEKNIFILPEDVLIIKLADLNIYFCIIVIRLYVKSDFIIPLLLKETL